MTSINIENISFSYTNQKGIFSNLSVKFEANEQVAIIGRNGSGKTTLAKLIIGMLKPNSGRITFNDKSIENESIANIAEMIGYVFQNPNIMLFTNSVEKELLLSLQRLSLAKDEKDAKVNEMLNFFGIEKYRKIHPRTLSRGEKQKLALATVLIQNPEAIILDEPFSGIDTAQKKIIREYIKKLKTQGKLILVITHDLDSVLEESNRIIALNKGTIVFDGEKNDFFSDSSNLEKVGLVQSSMLSMLNNLHASGLPSAILTKNQVIEYFSEKNQ